MKVDSLKILSGTQMARLDELSIRKHGISAKSLMRRAASQCLEEARKLKAYGRKAKVVIACGPGNNGGDGFALAGMLRKEGLEVSVFFSGDPERLSPESRFFYDQWASPIPSLKDSSFRKSLRRAHFVMDALFGTGLRRPVSGIYAEAIRAMNRAEGFKFAVDIPSGLSADTGDILGIAFRADLTVTFEAPKWGQLAPQAWDVVGRLVVKPIGLAHSEMKRFHSPAEWLDEAVIRPFFKARPKRSHKGSNGRVLVIAGSASMPGAGYLASLSALRSGAGLVVWALPEEAYRKIDLHYPEVILKPLSSQGGQFHEASARQILSELPNFQAVALGPGLGQGERVANFLAALLKKNRLPLVLDADGLNLAAKFPRLLKLLRNAVLTPHFKEFSRLSGRPMSGILEHRVEWVRAFLRRHHVHLVLKGYRSVCGEPKGKIWINSSGGPNLATAGSGDVLAGLIAGLLAQGLPLKEAMLSGTLLHGMAGDLVAENLGDRGTLASDVIEAIPKVLKKVIA